MKKAELAGIFSIVSGVFGFLWAASCLFAAFFIQYALNQSAYYREPMPAEFIVIIKVFYLVYGVILAALATLAIVGGVFALKKKRWGLALTGAVAAAITFFPLGITATVFVSLARPEFTSKTENPEVMK